MRKVLFGIFVAMLLFVSCNNSPSGQTNDNQNNPDNNGSEQNPESGGQDDKLYQIYFDSDELTLELGEEKVLSAVVRDKNGGEVENVEITYSSDREDLLVTSGNNAKAKMIGDVVITAIATIDDKEISSTCNCKISSNALEFISDNEFKVNSRMPWSSGEFGKTWDGEMYYYSYDESAWKIWSDLFEIESFKNSNKHFLFLRGRNNTIMKDSYGSHIRFDGEEFQVNGDIRLLLDYEKPDATTMADACFDEFFEDSQITSVPSLPSENLSKHCYYRMFRNCKKLTTIPTDLLPAKTLKEGCYLEMFNGCEKLLNSCALPAEHLPKNCYRTMFFGCTELTTLPSLKHISSVSDYSCSSMFEGCSNICISKSSAEESNEYIIPIDGKYIKLYYNCDFPSTFNSTFKSTGDYWGEKFIMNGNYTSNGITYVKGTYYYMKQGTYYTSNEVIYPPSEEENN